MELLNGRDLQAVLSGYPGGLAPNAAIALVTQAAEALQSAHDGSVIHRDLKPGNLFLQRSGQLKICDFGIAVAADTNSSLKADSYVLGTPAYMSPEQCDGLQGDERSDLYSLGCVLYALLTGRPPFPSGQPLAIMAHHRTTSPQSPDNVRQGIRPEVAKLVMQLLAKDPKRRPPSAQWVAAMLQAQLTRETTKAPGVKDTGAERHRFGATSGTGDSRSWPAATDEQDAVTRRRLMIAYEDYCLAQVAWEDANPARRGPEPRWEDYRARAFNSP
jgi:serine/threonine protein kinase